MNTITRISKAERFGHWLGRGWRGYMRGERRVSGWLVTQGLPTFISTALVWVVKLAVLAGLFYFAFWLALMLVLAVATAWVAGGSSEQDEPDFLGSEAEERDHRESLFYDPINYNDDPDPRFEDH
ncbi:DUF3742 family protein [Halopseudomonas pelagia]|uniref:DUF3742 family protein n=1 Tax=Halopseudomonas pelagia TaxID=553151 RepID=UPI00039DC888|nr:DUF3742 family protein [Halopseudomonas pelagia]